MGPCNLTDNYCMYDPSGATCLADNDPRRASPATLKVIAGFPHTIYQRTPLALAIEALSDTPTRERIDMCGGVLYRQCEIPGVTSDSLLGMCYSARMQVVACNVDQPFIQVRRVQIQRGVGLPVTPKKRLGLVARREVRVEHRIFMTLLVNFVASSLPKLEKRDGVKIEVPTTRSEDSSIN